MMKVKSVFSLIIMILLLTVGMIPFASCGKMLNEVFDLGFRESGVIDGYKWELDITTKVLTITYKTGAEPFNAESFKDRISAFNSVKEIILEDVVSIADNAFLDEGEISHISIPETVTECGEYIFAGLKNYENLKIDIYADTTKSGWNTDWWKGFAGRSQYLVRNGGELFIYGGYIDNYDSSFDTPWHHLLSNGLIQTISINGIIEIGKNAFRDLKPCTVTLDDSIRVIREGAFTTLDESATNPNAKYIINIPSSILRIESSTFLYWDYYAESRINLAWNEGDDPDSGYLAGLSYLSCYGTSIVKYANGNEYTKIIN